MSTTTLILGRDRPATSRWLSVAWIAVAGYVMGFTALQVIFDDGLMGHPPPWRVVVVALAPALLSALVGLVATAMRHWATTGFAALAGSLVAALACPPVTYLLLRLTGGRLGAGEGFFGTLVLVTLFGAFLAVPLGLLFGMVYAVVLAPIAAVRARAARAGIDAAAVLAGLGWMGVSLLSAFCSHALRADGMAPHHAWALSWGLALLGSATAAVGVARWELRRRFVARVRAGRAAGWALAPSDEIRGARMLPRLFPTGRADAVLLRRQETAEGPFRSGEASEPVLRV